jgi:hypothetical protein
MLLRVSDHANRLDGFNYGPWVSSLGRRRLQNILNSQLFWLLNPAPGLRGWLKQKDIFY